MFRFRTKQGATYIVNDEFIGVKGMTKQQATEKLLNLGYENGMLATALEALGLLKFEEAPGPDCRTIVFGSQTPCVYQAIAQLEALGYSVNINNVDKV